MTIEDRLRKAMTRRTQNVAPAPRSLSEIERRVGEAEADERPSPTRVLLGVAATILVLLVVGRIYQRVLGIAQARAQAAPPNGA